MIAAHVVLYGLLAAASALTITSVAVVLGTTRGRVNGAAFAAGFVVAQLLVALVALKLGTAVVPHHDTHRTFKSTLELLTGLALLAAAWYAKHAPQHPPRSQGTALVVRRDAALGRLSSLRPAAMLGAGGLLGVGGPKRLTLALLAAATIAAGGLSTTTEYRYVAVYVATATVLVWTPVTFAIVFGSRASEWTATVQAWWRIRRSTATFTGLLVLGAYFIAAAIVGFATN